MRVHRKETVCARDYAEKEGEIYAEIVRGDPSAPDRTAVIPGILLFGT